MMLSIMGYELSQKHDILGFSVHSNPKTCQRGTRVLYSIPQCNSYAVSTVVLWLVSILEDHTSCSTRITFLVSFAISL
jgi:hypothetical protein